MTRRPTLALAAFCAAAAASLLAVFLVLRRRGDFPRREAPGAALRHQVPRGGQPLPPHTSAQEAEAVARAVARLTGPDMGQKELRKSLTGLAVSKDPRAVRIILALCDGDSGHSATLAAVEALGDVRSPESRTAAAAKARAKMDDADPQVAAAAARSLARLREDEAVPDIISFIHARQAAPDGYELVTASAGAEALGLIGTPAAVAALCAELGRAAGEPGWVMDYGSAVVQALDRGRTPPEAAAALTAYAELLASRMPGPDDPNGRRYYEEKIAEARKAALHEIPPPSPKQQP